MSAHEPISVGDIVQVDPSIPGWGLTTGVVTIVTTGSVTVLMLAGTGVDGKLRLRACQFARSVVRRVGHAAWLPRSVAMMAAS